MNDTTSMTEIWSRPWHALQRSLAWEVPQQLPSKPAQSAFALDDASPVSSWLARALGETAAHAHYLR